MMSQNQLDKSSKHRQGKSNHRLANGRSRRHPKQEQIEEALLFMEDIIRCSSSAIAACDLEGNMTYGNPAFHQMWGFDDPKEHLGKPFWQFWLVEDRLDEIMQALRGDGLWFDRIKARRKDGATFDVQVSASMVFDRKGDPVALTSTSIDITESERLKEKLDQQREVLQRIYDNIPVLLVMWEPQLRRFTLNHYAEAVLGWTIAEANQGNFLEKVYPDEAYRAEVVEYMMLLEPSWREWINTTKEGARVPIDWTNIRLSDDIMIAIGVDLRERKQTEETIRLAQAQLVLQRSETDYTNDELSQYAYAVSHDLKAPLRAIQNYADFLYEDLFDTLSGDQKIYLDGLKKAVAEGNELINGLLSIARLGRSTPVVEAVYVPGVIDEIRSLLNLPHDVEIDVQQQWPVIWVDHTLFKQVLQNLIANGIKFNVRSPKRIAIGWQSAPNERIEIFVRDNGIGIMPEYQKQIFQIFRRLHTSREYDGTGIGLAIVQKAAQNLGGSVRLESTVGEGSTFYVILPSSILENGRDQNYQEL
jgi:two-component system sensor kinase FixL